ncbi:MULTISPECIES: hypothetical protein [Paenibacillus]|uniref:DUF4402 domain-containing protein n=1 Tax=Paenibacillus borealis TaxID=160799 RepID=A0ABX3HIA1_PAEBO|nr:hypothetical protein [Paenibacillus borealis]OMD50334.1 hypothetical protein BSK56_07310 [Paenibacillus borealis]
MKFGKKLIASTSIIVASLAVAVTAFANTDTKNVNGYGTLKGTLSASGSTANYSTSVSSNSDRAYLTIAGSAQNVNGTTVITKSQINSSRGATSYNGYLSPLGSNVYVVYGTHGVQGGSTYSADAVFTYTHL